NTERLSESDVEAILEDAYVPGYKLTNPALRTWFSETDAWWFDNVRRNLDRIESPYQFALGATLAMGVGDHVLSFDESTRELRQPLSAVYKRLWANLPTPINNSQNNSCQNKTANEFLAENFGELLFLHVPDSRSGYDRFDRWREEWLRQANDFWLEIETAQSGKLGATATAKSQQIHALEETLSIASNIKHWAIAHNETGLLSTQDVIDVVTKLRRVDKIFTKDFSELTGAKAAIITA
ncbi:MAG: hypothetical protein ACJ72Z_09790, partial [Pyrinomonadaceae bacterium]